MPFADAHAFLDFADLDGATRYKLLTSTIVPRPIAWVTTLDGVGGVNAAPFSFFNVLVGDPPILAVSIGRRPESDAPKDSIALIRERGELVVNLVGYEQREQMNVTATDFPAGQTEVAPAGLDLAPSRLVAPPRIAEAPVAFEARVRQLIEIGHNTIVLAEVVAMHIREDALDRERFHVDTAALDLIGRMGGGGGYVRTTDRFEIPRISYEQWRAAAG
jgi:flavin reductase (DIM6/NTAB) family NADH-FMN oxidoreductase RutF